MGPAMQYSRKVADILHLNHSLEAETLVTISSQSAAQMEIYTFSKDRGLM
jgi:copper(I)-binding protein